jgi:hypothetical protein
MLALELAVVMMPGVILAAFILIWVSTEDKARRQHRR